MRVNRQGIIIWFQHRRNIKHIRRYGNLIYVSFKMRYALLYVNQSEIDDIIEQMEKLRFVSKIEKSYRPFLKYDYDQAQRDQAKEYDYKMGT